MRSLIVNTALLVSVLGLTQARAQFSFPVGEPEPPLAWAHSTDPRLKVLVPSPDLQPSQIAVIVNTQDKQSVEVAAYYKKIYGLNESQIIELTFQPANEVAYGDFAVLASQVRKQLPSNTEALAISWTRPYRITFTDSTCALAVTAGFAFKQGLENYCEMNNNYRTFGQKVWGKIAGKPQPNIAVARSGLFDSHQFYPATQAGILPSMMLAGRSVKEAKALIDRGFASRQQHYPRNIHLFLSRDSLRTKPRGEDFKRVVDEWQGRVDEKPTLWNPGNNQVDVLSGQKDVGVYFIGRSKVPHLAKNTYIPGAVADSLTSYGGYLLDPQGQTTALEFLEAGATGSYGTVIEPYAIAERFPKASVFLRHYLSGRTLVQAYWHSVQDPMLGVFLGDPLSRPYGNQAEFDPDTETLTITTSALEPGREYQVVDYTPFDAVTYPCFRAGPAPHVVTVPDADPTHRYRLEPCHPRHALLVND